MNPYQLATKFNSYIVRFIQLQLFITLFSLPILIAWGLPFSLLSPLGNLLFGPLLTLFLFLSSVIFFTELLYIPNGLALYCLEKLTSWWLFIMHADTQRWLLGFTKPSPYFLTTIVALSILIMVFKKTNGIYVSIACFSALFFGVSLYLHCMTSQHSSHSTLACNKGEIHIIVANNKLVVIDPGFIGQRLSAPSFVQYTLIPHLIKLTGKTKIDHLILLQPGELLFEAVERLCTKIKVKNIYLVCWDGPMQPSSLWRYGALRRAMQKNEQNFSD